MPHPLRHPDPDPRAVARVPVLRGEPHRLLPMPDLGELAGPVPERQHIVDHHFLRCPDGSWRLWACIRGCAVGRILYRWAADDFRGPWRPLGVAARADAAWGEQADGDEKIGAPFFIEHSGEHYCVYHSETLRIARIGADGEGFQRLPWGGDQANVLYPHGGRDAMLTRFGARWFCYSCVTTGSGPLRSFVMLRTSPDLVDWSDYLVVNEGGILGNGPVAAESPYVIELDGYWYLFRTSSITFETAVYRSRTPYHFGCNSDEHLVTILPIKAPELLQLDGRWYATDLADFQGLLLHELEWPEAEGAAGAHARP